MTHKEMIKIIEEKRLNELTQEQKKEVMTFAFGSEFINSNNKGKKVIYK